MRHTNGPWKALQSPLGLQPWLIYDVTGEWLVCDLRNTEVDKKCDEGNARLIASAPELLEALRAAYSHLHSEVGDKEYVEAVVLQALSKAEGEEK